MRYTEEIFNILSKGGFISANSVSSAIKRFYDALEEDFTDYYEYYKGIAVRNSFIRYNWKIMMP